MDAKIKKADFSFEKFTVSSFSFNEPINHDGTLDIDLKPTGIFRVKDSKFDLLISFCAKVDKTDFEIVRCEYKSTFRFNNIHSIDQIPSFFYKNCIAISFPYLRAFLSTLTLQANTPKMMILPLLNLSNLEQYLKDNIKVED